MAKVTKQSRVFWDTKRRSAGMIDKRRLLRELRKAQATPSRMGFSPKADLGEAFIWHESPQGHKFWARLFWGARLFYPVLDLPEGV